MAVFQEISRAHGTGMGEVMPVPGMAEVWQVYRCLTEIRSEIGLGHQVLATLRALLSFLKEGQPAMVYAANRTIQARAEGRPERTIRRHLAELIKIGLISRRQSANGKRGRIESPEGAAEAFGLDLSPLLRASKQIINAAAEAQREKQAIAFQRKRLSALIWRAGCTTVQSTILDELRPMLRRKLGSLALAGACKRLETLIAEAEAEAHAAALALTNQEADTPLPSSEHPQPALPCPAGNELSTPPYPAHTKSLAANGGKNDRHKNRTEKKISDSERAVMREAINTSDPRMLEKIIDSNPDLATWSSERPRSWFEVEELAFRIGEWSGIGRDLLIAAIKRIGRRESAIRLLALGRSPVEIRNLPAYFNAVTVGRKAASYDPLRLIFGLQPAVIRC